MERKARQRITYVLPLADSPNGHRLGVNGLAVDRDRSVLYSAGRDGVICAWSLDLDLKSVRSESRPKSESASRWKSQVQAHTHWVNDIVLAQQNAALVSASSDLTVKVWRPNAEDHSSPQTIGLHSDYVKRVAAPNTSSNWIASGGLDRKVCLWDLNGGGKQLQIEVGEEGDNAKGSIYALSVHGGVIASGGPENIVRLWDPKSGRRITKFVGHTGTIRDILINEDGDTIMTASSDQTVKVWSVTAGRCMHTLTMHNDSVWSLYSEHPDLAVFYSSDRSGLVAKTDVREAAEMDEGLSVAVCQEHEGVNKVVSKGGYVWTSTSNSSINRWRDVDTEAEVQMLASQRQQRFSISTARSKQASPPRPADQPLTNGHTGPQIPLKSVLRLSNTASLPNRSARDPESGTMYSSTSARQASDAMGPELDGIVPVHSLPEESIEGHNGLIQHIMLNDRRRVLTLDTAGEIVLWDLLQCAPVKSFGKRHLEDVASEVNTVVSSIANWCTVDTRTGTLACVLEENHCFDAEIYADELELEESIDFREDQRINLGKWVLRYLFSNLIDEEIQRDIAYRKSIEGGTHQGSLQRGNAPPSIKLPPQDVAAAQGAGATNTSPSTPRASDGAFHPSTPGLSISIATPSGPSTHPANHADSHLPTTVEEGVDLEKRASHQSQPRASLEKAIDYFSPTPNPQASGTPPMNGNNSATNADQKHDGQTAADGEKEAHGKEGGSLFGRKFKMSFGTKKLRTSSMDANKPAVVDEKVEDSDGDKSLGGSEQTVEDNLFGVVQKIRHEYDQHLRDVAEQPLSTGITPSLPNETPVLKPPPRTAVIIQEDQPDSGGVADLYRGTVACVGEDADVIEKKAPMWLGDLLLRNQVPFKELAKISFVLLPWQDELPRIPAEDGNDRLNANRLLRAKKVLTYVSERIEPQPEHPEPDALKPEEYLELYCQNQFVPPNMTLANLRLQIWKTGGDVVLYYKGNGKKEIAAFAHAPAEPESSTATDGGASGEQAVHS